MAARINITATGVKTIPANHIPKKGEKISSLAKFSPTENNTKYIMKIRAIACPLSGFTAAIVQGMRNDTNLNDILCLSLLL